MNSKTIYNYIIFKEIHPGYFITEESLKFTDKLIDFVFYSIMLYYQNYENLVKSVELILSGKLYEHGSREAYKACERFSNSINLDEKTRYSKSRSEHSKLSLNVLTVEEMLKKFGITSITNYFLIYLTTVLEYILAEIMELSANISRNKNKLTVTVDHIIDAINADDELRTTFNHIANINNNSIKIDWSTFIENIDSIYQFKLTNIFCVLNIKKFDDNLPYNDSFYLERDLLFDEISLEKYKLNCEEDLKQIELDKNEQMEVELNDEIEDQMEEEIDEHKKAYYTAINDIINNKEMTFFTFSKAELEEHDRKVIENYLKEKELSNETMRKRKYKISEENIIE